MKNRNKHIRNIEHEKLRLRVKQLELEKQIRNDWMELKGELPLSNFFYSRGSAGHQSKTRNGLFSQAISYGLSYMTRRFSESASQKIEAGIKNGIDKLTEKLKVVFAK